MLHLILALFVSVSGFNHLVHASLKFTISHPQECITFNVTWKPDASAFPYSVYLLVINSPTISWRIDSNYQPNSSEITFQYVLPKIGQDFKSFIVAVVDNKGNGNNSEVFVPTTLNRLPSNCSDFILILLWRYAADTLSPNGTDPHVRPQCSVVHYYPVHPPFTGTGPFSISLVPVQDKPITVNVPKSATNSTSYFDYDSILPFKQGKQYYSFMSDALGSGSGGGGPLYTIRPSQIDSCTKNYFKLSNQNKTHALPVGSELTSFQDLAGAVTSASGGTKVVYLGNLLGGILSTLFGLLLVAFITYKVYCMIQKRRQQLNRMEDAQFVDLGESIYDQGQSTMKYSTMISPFPFGSDEATYAEHVNENRDAIGLRAMSKRERLTALGTSLGDKISIGLRRVPKSEALRFGSNNKVSLPNFNNDASQALLDDANELAGQSVPMQHGQNESQGNDVDESLQVRSGSVNTSATNPISTNVVMVENKLSTAEANMSSTHGISPTPNNPDQSAGADHESKVRQFPSFMYSSNQTTDSRYKEQFDAEPMERSRTL
ncbi:uncharacterized protein FA14DRAFT_178532 [Meira miltonrushii]|uniref:Fibronectin type-III domain-containing protein n=1 Tax=Meira miltonrushii TaxID=1280837 RepID=A0A316VI12_9BASI|nr:uncharacterized protein FA14DRAFT_178532 [Meira miltonrushii]PWN35155.1 hypothetical protein FA14DRAFT_178532 [Meira miltonrushii]